MTLLKPFLFLFECDFHARTLVVVIVVDSFLLIFRLSRHTVRFYKFVSLKCRKNDTRVLQSDPIVRYLVILIKGNLTASTALFGLGFSFSIPINGRRRRPVMIALSGTRRVTCCVNTSRTSLKRTTVTYQLFFGRACLPLNGYDLTRFAHGRQPPVADWE